MNRLLSPLSLLLRRTDFRQEPEGLADIVPADS
jgi:hypothetical protein